VSDELSDEQLATLHAALLTLRDELTDMVELSHDAAQPVDLDQPIGRVSRIDAIQQQQMADSNRRNAAQRLGQVKAALAAFDRGEYGLCATCEEPIAFRRLTARPEARLCVSCQSARER
jgi:DnaK suppressor protein